MAKKKVKEVDEAAKQAEMRLAAIREYNVNNMGDSWIDPNHVPTEEEVAEAKKEFEDRTKALQEKNDYLVADKPNALRVAKFIKNFIENGFWAQRYFVGVINFAEYMVYHSRKRQCLKNISKCLKKPNSVTIIKSVVSWNISRQLTMWDRACLYFCRKVQELYSCSKDG